MIKLEWQGRTLDLNDCVSGYYVTEFNPGFPEVRQATWDNPDWDGIQDETRFFGPRVITVQGVLAGNGVTKERLASQLAGFLHPNMRPTLTYQLDPRDAPRQTVVRVDTMDAPFTPSKYDEFQVNWIAADPFWYATEETSISLSLAGATIRGITFNITFHWRFPLVGGGRGLGLAVVEGVATPPHIQLFGYCVNPRVINQTTGQQLAIAGTIQAGDYLDIDGASHTITLNGVAGADRYYMLDFPNSDWWLLQPGPNSLRFTADEVEGAATAVISWRVREVA